VNTEDDQDLLHFCVRAKVAGPSALFSSLAAFAAITLLRGAAAGPNYAEWSQVPTTLVDIPGVGMGAFPFPETRNANRYRFRRSNIKNIPREKS